MHLVKYVQKKAKPWPGAYRFLTHIYSIYGEASFFLHALFNGKLTLRHDRGAFANFLSRQKILTYPLPGTDFGGFEGFRRWLQETGISFVEGGWTFYIPPQENLKRQFHFLENYPSDAGLKVLKDFRPPLEARYTNHKQHPAPGAALKRLLTYSPVSLLRVANYLYAHDLGMRVYDLVALEGEAARFTCYVVHHVEGPDVERRHYDSFMAGFRALLERDEITTIHEAVDIMSDFEPPDCSKNLIVSSKDNKPLYVDFQGFLFKDEEKMIENLLEEVKEKVHFGGVRFYRGGGRYLYQSIPGLSVGKRDMETRWRNFLEMMENCGCSFRDRVVYDIGCNTGLALYNGLSEGAKWGIGWDMPEVVDCAKRVLLGLGATRFDLFGRIISGDTDFKSDIPERYRRERRGILFYLAVIDHIGFPGGVSEIPWEYMFFEGHGGQNYEECLKRVRSVPWLRSSEVLTHRSFSDGDSPTRVVILLRRRQ